MQPLAISALVITAVLILGAATTLFLTRKNGTRGPVTGAITTTRQQRSGRA